MLVYRRECDFCGKPLEHNGDLIIKRRWAVWDFPDWTRLDVCSECAEKIKLFIRKERPENE